MFIVEVGFKINCWSVHSLWFFQVAIGSKKRIDLKDEIDWYDAKGIGAHGKG